LLIAHTIIVATTTATVHVKLLAEHPVEIVDTIHAIPIAAVIIAPFHNGVSGSKVVLPLINKQVVIHRKKRGLKF